MIASIKIRLFYILSGVFIAANSVMIALDSFYLLLSPVAIALALLLLFSIDKFLLFTALLVPLSVNLSELDLGFAVSLPAEPLIVMLMVGFLFKALIEQSMDQRTLKHPITIVILLSLVWMAVTSFTSEIPLVSFKYLAARLWFVVPFYFLGSQVFKDYRLINRFTWCYIISFSGVIVYSTYRLAIWNFEKEPAHWVMTPFYYDHTQYGAMLAFFVPFLVAFSLKNRMALFGKILSISITILFLAGLILSNSRAAWLSIVVAIIVYLIILLRVKWYLITAVAGVLAGFYFAFQTEITMKLQKNKQDSSGNLTEHVQSMSNISTDASNLERLLRWNCAIRMYNERPITGWGPGTYMFTYAPFQRSNELTIISTNFGDGGNAHSEYLGSLSEQGILGLLFMLATIVVVSIYALRVIKNAKDKYIQRTAIGLYLGLVTYWIHGLLNNFLDTDKAAVPYWAFIGGIVALDIYHRSMKTSR